MIGKPTTLFVKRAGFVAIAVLALGVKANAQQAGAFNVAYGYSATSQARTAAPTSDAMAGTASFGVFLPKDFLLAGSTQTFTSSHSPGSSRTWGYGVTKFEINHDWTLWKKQEGAGPTPRSLHFEADYTITLPTDGNEPAGVEHYGHQFLGMLDYFRSPQNYFEVDGGDFMGGRDAAPGYKHTALLSLIAQHNLRANGNSGTNFDFELDASPSSEGAPASAILTAGAEHTFKSKVTLTALALVGLTANDPAVGVSLRIKFTGSLSKKQGEARVLSFSKLQRLETRFFGKIGRF
uniref:Uncharacterized protein n=1 Tax=Solibacter usitatus (strain Ellin6076) TaxID=234267 RepID=Q01YN2_SOLUE